MAVIHPFTQCYETEYDEVSIRYNHEFYNPIIELAMKKNMCIAYENMIEYPEKRRFSLRADELTQLLDSYNDPRIGACWDFGYGNRMYRDQSRPIRVLNKRLTALFDRITAVDVRFDGKIYRNRYWSEVLEPCGAEIIAEYASSYKDGWPAFSYHKYGAGDAYYLGTSLTEDGERELYNRILMKSGVKPFPFVWDNNVEIIKRVGHEEIYYFVFNMAEDEKSIEYFGNGVEILSGRFISGKAKLLPKEVLVIKEY